MKWSLSKEIMDTTRREDREQTTLVTHLSEGQRSTLTRFMSALGESVSKNGIRSGLLIIGLSPLVLAGCGEASEPPAPTQMPTAPSGIYIPPSGTDTPTPLPTITPMPSTLPTPENAYTTQTPGCTNGSPDTTGWVISLPVGTSINCTNSNETSMNQVPGQSSQYAEIDTTQQPNPADLDESVTVSLPAANTQGTFAGEGLTPPNSVPGGYFLIIDANGNWQIRFFTSATSYTVTTSGSIGQASSYELTMIENTNSQLAFLINGSQIATVTYNAAGNVGALSVMHDGSVPGNAEGDFSNYSLGQAPSGS